MSKNTITEIRNFLYSKKGEMVIGLSQNKNVCKKYAGPQQAWSFETKQEAIDAYNELKDEFSNLKPINFLKILVFRLYREAPTYVYIF